MTTSNQIIAIAELDGWEYVDTIPATALWKEPYRRFREPINSEIVSESHLPKYLTSRDAIVPVIEKCSKILENDNHMFVQLFLQHLEEIIRRDDKTSRRIQFYLLVSTPQQLCEALLRATGKWKD